MVAGQTLRLIHCAGRTEMSDKPRMMAPMVMPRTPKRTMERLTLMATMTTDKKLDAAALCRVKRLTDVGPVTHADGCDPFRVSDEFAPSFACGVDDRVVVFEHGV